MSVERAAPRGRATDVGARTWLGIGLNSFGGPAGQISVMHRELVERRRWLSERRFLHGLNYAMVLPGPEAQQLATYIGLLMSGVRGALVAGSLFVLPGAVFMLAVSIAYVELGDVGWMSALFGGLAAAVIALVAQAVLRIGARTLRTPALGAIAAAAFLALGLFAVGFPLVIASAAVIGLVIGRRSPALLTSSVGGRVSGGEAGESGGAAGGGTGEGVGGGTGKGAGGAALGTSTLLGDDDSMSPVQRRSAWRAGLACLGMWLAPILALVVGLGPQHVLSQIALLFARTALITFGGAYAVLSYVTEQATVVHGWLTPDEMATGLGLAESTPGPLILVLQFVGFLAAYNDPGGMPALVSGTLGALVTLWVTFVPCFMLIYLGAPHAERLRGNAAVHHALTAISAAVVGVIANLGLWLAGHTLFEQTQMLAAGPLRVTVPVLASFDPGVAAVAALGGALVFGARWATHWVLLACAGAGVALGLVGWA